jgi:hypothetical protein
MAWNLPPGCTQRDIDEAAGANDEPPHEPLPCPFCHGRGRYDRDGTHYYCDQCDGTGSA